MIKHLELFSGIGGFRKAIDLLADDFSFQSKCVGFSEKDSFAIKTYKANFAVDNDEIDIGNLVDFTNDIQRIESLPEFQLLTGGFPCQAFSMMGKQRGFDDERGNVFYRIADILRIKKPPLLLLENVKNLKNHDSGRTYKEIIRTLNDCGYKSKNIHADIFNTANFSLAQVRNRIFIFATLFDLPDKFKFSEKNVIESFTQINGSAKILRQKSILDVLSRNVDAKYYLSDRIKPTILADGSGNFVSKSEINQLTARPLTATMVKMHRACQDNYYSDTFIHSKDPVEFVKLPIEKEELKKQRIRKLTPGEALALQGFDSDFYYNAVKAGLSDHQLYKQAGNAVSVNTVYAILHYILISNRIMRYVL